MDDYSIFNVLAKNMTMTRNTAAGPVTVAGPILTTRAGPVDARHRCVIVTDRSCAHGTVDYDSLNPDIKNKTKINFSICGATGLVPLCYARRLRSGAPRYVADEVQTPVRRPYEEVGWRPSAIVSEVVVG